MFRLYRYEVIECASLSYPEEVIRDGGTQCTIKWDSDQVNPLWKIYTL